MQRALAGISPKVLTACLRALKQHGIIWREATDDMPLQVGYGLSEKGADVHTHSRSLVWSSS